MRKCLVQKQESCCLLYATLSIKPALENKTRLSNPFLTRLPVFHSRPLATIYALKKSTLTLSTTTSSKGERESSKESLSGKEESSWHMARNMGGIGRLEKEKGGTFPLSLFAR